MQEAWIQLQCPDCAEQWEANPADLPEPSDEYECASCGSPHRLSELAKTTRGLEILEEFHAE